MLAPERPDGRAHLLLVLRASQFPAPPSFPTTVPASALFSAFTWGPPAPLLRMHGALAATTGGSGKWVPLQHVQQ
jgi:hypothetical protein